MYFSINQLSALKQEQSFKRFFRHILCAFFCILLFLLLLQDLNLSQSRKQEKDNGLPWRAVFLLQGEELCYQRRY